MNGYTHNSNGKVHLITRFPKPKPCPPQQPTVVVVPEQKCMKNCCPVLSKGCDLNSSCCGDYYMKPVCDSVGITGLLHARPCLVYDEQWGGCGECIGCKHDCDHGDFCPYQGYNRDTFHHGRGQLGNGDDDSY